MAKRKEPQVKSGVRYDRNHTRLRNGEGQKPDGTYCFRWTDKLRKRHAVYARTLSELREKEELIYMDMHDNIRPGAANMTLNELYDLWLDIKRGIKDSTMSNYKYVYGLFVKPVFGKNKLRDIRRSDVRRFYINLLEVRGISLATVDNVHTILHQIFQIAVDDDIIRKNPSDNMIRELRLVNGENIEKREALTFEQQKLFLDYMKQTPRYSHWFPIFYIMLNTGMRMGEITGLRHSDIHTDRRTGRKYISVNHTLVYYKHTKDPQEGCYYSINTPKTKAGARKIPISESVEKAFEMEAEYQKLAGITCRSHVDGYQDFIFLNSRGSVYSANSLNRAIQRIVRDCNSEILEREGFDNDPVLLPHFSTHVLRHTFATRAAESGVLSPKTLQSVLGHSDISTTFNIYVSCNETVKSIEIKELEKYIETGRKPGYPSGDTDETKEDKKEKTNGKE